MSQKIIQDIYVSKKSIRMVKKSDLQDDFSADKKAHGRHHKEMKNDIDVVAPDEIEIEREIIIEERDHVTKDSMMVLWIICIVALGTLLFFLSSYFVTTTISVTPKNEQITLDDTYNLTSDINAAGLHFQVSTITKDLSKKPETDGEEYVEKKAIGKAVIYNNYSTSKQRLINNTRLETKEGLIYRIRQSVEIPGVKTISGVKTPGSAEVEIIADMPGDKYNMKLSDLKGDFTIPGFKGSTKYTAFYARLSADVVGGYVGNIKKVSDDKVLVVRDELKNTLKADLIKEIYSKLPEQYVLFKDDYFVNCKDLEDTFVDGQYNISEECTINAVIFNKEELSQYIAKDKVNNFDGSKVDIIWGDNSVVVLQGATEKPWNETSVKAKFSGLANIVWQFEKDKIANAIVGQNKNIIPDVLELNKINISKIDYSIRPGWKSTFPNNISKIKIVDTIRDVEK